MAKSAKQALYFTRIQLTNWRNFRQAEVALQRRAFFVGANASGKSNLLDAFRFLRDLAAAAGGGLQAAVQDRGGVSQVRSLFARNPGHVEVEVDVGDEDEPGRWTYRLRFTKDKGRDRAIIEEEAITHREAGRESWTRLRRRADEPDEEVMTQTELEQITQNKNFRELTEFFASIRYLHVVPQIVRDDRRHVKEAEDPFGGDLLQRMSATLERTRNARLRAISQAVSKAVPNFEDLTLVHDRITGTPHLEAKLRNWRPQPAIQQEGSFSDGTLRLIGFLWSLSERGGPLLLEEPELSLNEAIVRRLADQIARIQRRSGRQVLATTHAPALLEGVAPDEAHMVFADKTGSRILRAYDDPAARALIDCSVPHPARARPCTG